MFNIKKEYLIVAMLVLVLGFLSIKNSQSESNLNSKVFSTQNQKVILTNKESVNIDNPFNMPIPVEIAQKKEDRKKFKKLRKEYIDLIHKTDSDVNWRKMDSEFREERSLEKTQQRKEYINQNGYWDSEREVFLNRELEGVWQERGSNNLAGRVHTVDIDFNNDLIYLASSGGNIWKGTIDGENWESLTIFGPIRYQQSNKLEEKNPDSLYVKAKGGIYSRNDGVALYGFGHFIYQKYLNVM